MAYDVLISEPAERDMAEILTYIKVNLCAPEAAKKLLAELKEQIMSLSTQPERCPLVLDEVLAQKGYRKLIVQNYIVFYIVSHEEKCVMVYRVLYGRRQWESLL